MSLRFRLPLAAALLGAGLLVAPGAAPAGAGPVTQDLQVSATSGAAGDVISVSSASCVLPDDADGFRFLTVRFISGTAPDEVLAGVGSGEGSATFVVPAWIDPDAPAVVEASCEEVTFPPEGDPVQTSTDYDPVTFDVVADPGAPTQDRTFSRTTVAVGQGFKVEVTGCDLSDAQYIEVDAMSGDDLSGRTLDQVGFLGYGPIASGAGTAEVVASNGSAGVTIGSSGGNDPVVEEVDETPTDLSEGTYTAITGCVAADGTILLFEPQLVEVQGTNPVGSVDLTVPAQSHTATMEGGSCTQPSVSARMDLESASSIDSGFDAAAPALASGPDAALAAAKAKRSAPGTGAVRVRVARVPRRAGRGLRAAQQVVVPAVPDPSGAWSASATATFDEGVVFGIASCGDPFAEGFAYDVQVAKVHVVAATTTSTSTTTTAPTPPANAVSGTPTYAG